jgi:hypothetical protein
MKKKLIEVALPPEAKRSMIFARQNLAELALHLCRERRPCENRFHAQHAPIHIELIKEEYHG